MDKCPVNTFCEKDCGYETLDAVESCGIFHLLQEEADLEIPFQEWEFVQEHYQKEESNARSL